MVQRQAGFGGGSGQLAGPVLALRGDDACLVAEQVRLPGTIVGVLDRQRRPIRLASSVSGTVRGHQVGEQHAAGPVVAGDVVDHQRHHQFRPALTVDAEHRGADRPVVFQVEGVALFAGQFAAQPVFAVAAGPPHQEVRCHVVDDLIGRAVDLAVCRAQDRVPLDDISKSRHQCVDVARARQTGSERDVVDGVGAFDAVAEPRSQLRGRQRRRTVLRLRHQPRSGAAAVRGEGVDVFGEPRHGVELEDVTHTDVGPAPGADLGDQFGGQQ